MVASLILFEKTHCGFEALYALSDYALPSIPVGYQSLHELLVDD